MTEEFMLDDASMAHILEMIPEEDFQFNVADDKDNFETQPATSATPTKHVSSELHPIPRVWDQGIKHTSISLSATLHTTFNAILQPIPIKRVMNCNPEKIWCEVLDLVDLLGAESSCNTFTYIPQDVSSDAIYYAITASVQRAIQSSLLPNVPNHIQDITPYVLQLTTTYFCWATNCSLSKILFHLHVLTHAARLEYTASSSTHSNEVLLYRDLTERISQISKGHVESLKHYEQNPLLTAFIRTVAIPCLLLSVVLCKSPMSVRIL